MSSYTITFEMTETIEAEDKQSAIEEFIEKLRDMSSEKIAKVLEVRWYE